jgi:hypothetical protein
MGCEWISSDAFESYGAAADVGLCLVERFHLFTTAPRAGGAGGYAKSNGVFRHLRGRSRPVSRPGLIYDRILA